MLATHVTQPGPSGLAAALPEDVSRNAERVYGILVPLELLALAGYVNIVFLRHGIQGEAARDSCRLRPMPV
jgi:hypothetical protein